MQQVNQQSEKKTGVARRVLVTLAGVALCVVGIALPVREVRLVLAGLEVLASEYPWAHRMTGPVRKRATQAAAQSVASSVRTSATALCGLALIGAGLAWILVPALPLGGMATGSSLIVSGIVV